MAVVQRVIFVVHRGTGTRADSKGFWGWGGRRSCLVVPARKENLTPSRCAARISASPTSSPARRGGRGGGALPDFAQAGALVVEISCDLPPRSSGQAKASIRVVRLPT